MALPVVKVELGFGYQASQDGTPVAVTWTDVTDYCVEHIEWERGVQRFDGVYGRVEAGMGKIVLDNSDRRFDPTNLAGPYVSGGVTQLIPGVPFRISFTFSAVTYYQWYGYTDDYELAFDGFPGYATTTVTGVDAVSVLANFDLPTIASSYAGDDTGARITRILDLVNFDTSLRSIDTGKSKVQATTFGSNAWTEILLTADSEIGEVTVDAQGVINFRNRWAILQSATSNTSQATYGDAVGELPYEDVSVLNDQTQVRNEIDVANAGGTLQTATTSPPPRPVRAWGRRDLILQTDTEALNYAQYVLAINKDPELRFGEIDLLFIDNTNSFFAKTLSLALGNRITTKLRPPGGGSAISRDAFVRGISGSVATDGTNEIRMKLTLQSATKFSFFVLDSPTLGTLDTPPNALGY